MTVTVDGDQATGTSLSVRQAWSSPRNAYIGKLVVGRELGIPVSAEYRPPFSFTGQVHQVSFEAFGAPPTSRREQLATALWHE